MLERTQFECITPKCISVKGEQAVECGLGIVNSKSSDRIHAPLYVEGVEINTT
jgi:hypothetical protein